jgi:hypothetical protein
VFSDEWGDWRCKKRRRGAGSVASTVDGTAPGRFSSAGLGGVISAYNQYRRCVCYEPD